MLHGEVQQHASDGWSTTDLLVDGRMHLEWPGLLDCLIAADGSQVLAAPLSERFDEAFLSYLFGNVISYVLLSHGIEPIHATVLARDGHGLAVLGDSGYGKSTLAAALVVDGWSLVTDDLLVLDVTSDPPFAMPGLPRLKLWPEAAARFLPSLGPGTPVAPGVQKRIYPLGGSEWRAVPTELKVVYVLDAPADQSSSEEVTILDLELASAFMALTRNTFNSVLTTPERLTRHFSFAERVVRTLPVRSLSYPPGLDRLGDVVTRLGQDVASAP
jgi:hypothetical protein